MYNPESILENKMHKLLWDFEIQTDHLISSRRPGLEIVIKKENQSNSGVCRSNYSLGKTERKRKERSC